MTDQLAGVNPIRDWRDLEKVSSDLLRRRQAFEIQQWEKWRQGGESPDDLRPLLQSMRPLIRKQVNVFKGRVRDIPPVALEAEFNRHAMTAFRTFDPHRGTKLSTHVRNQLQKAKRYVATHQNLAYIPEHRVWRIGEFQTAQGELQERFGREPTNQEISEHLKWAPNEVDRMQRELRRDLPASGFVSAEGGSADPYAMMPSREREVLNLIEFELSPEEKLVFDYTYGRHGKPQMKPGEISRKLRFSPSKVSRLRKSISGKIDRYLQP
jgi:RNA polymerase primary sigma factor